ncbi:MAG: hypothetical protein IJE97_15530 [Thermoguttaceae bacterium]|nr:hypothetical protein [Thermoguttaceae bacterium]
MGLLGAAVESDEVAEWLSNWLFSKFVEDFAFCTFVIFWVAALFICRRRRWRKLFYKLRAPVELRRRKLRLRAAAETLRKLARAHKIRKQVAFESGMRAIASALKAKDETSFRATLTIAERSFVEARAATNNRQTTTAQVAAAVAAFYRDDWERVVELLKTALSENVFVVENERSDWTNYVNYYYFFTLKYEIWNFLASRQVCDSYLTFWKKAWQTFEELRLDYKNRARQSRGAEARELRAAAKRTKQFQRTLEKLFELRWLMAPGLRNQLFLRVEKKMRRVYKRVRAVDLADYAADVYRSTYFLPIDGKGPPSLRRLCWKTSLWLMPLAFFLGGALAWFGVL